MGVGLYLQIDRKFESACGCVGMGVCHNKLSAVLFVSFASLLIPSHDRVCVCVRAHAHLCVWLCSPSCFILGTQQRPPPLIIKCALLVFIFMGVI